MEVLIARTLIPVSPKALNINPEIIGASSDPRKLGGRAVAQNIDLGYAGELYLVNPAGGLIQGRESVTSIDDLPEGIDCALIVRSPKPLRKLDGKRGAG